MLEISRAHSAQSQQQQYWSMNDNNLRRSQYVTCLPTTKCAFVEQRAFTFSAAAQVKFVTIIQSQSQKSSCSQCQHPVTQQQGVEVKPVPPVIVFKSM